MFPPRARIPAPNLKPSRTVKMRKTPKPPEKKLPLGAWVLAALVAFLLSATAFFNLYAADPGRDDNLTSSELCQDSCTRDQTVCTESSGNRQALENYGDETTQRVGLQAN